RSDFFTREEVIGRRIQAHGQLAAVLNAVRVGIGQQRVGAVGIQFGAVLKPVAICISLRDVRAGLQFFQIAQTVAIGIGGRVGGVIRVQPVGDFRDVENAVAIGIGKSPVADLRDIVFQADEHVVQALRFKRLGLGLGGGGIR